MRTDKLTGRDKSVIDRNTGHKPLPFRLYPLQLQHEAYVGALRLQPA